MGLSEEEGAKYWDREAENYNKEVEKHRDRYYKLVECIIELTASKLAKIKELQYKHCGDKNLIDFGNHLNVIFEK